LSEQFTANDTTLSAEGAQPEHMMQSAPLQPPTAPASAADGRTSRRRSRRALLKLGGAAAAGVAVAATELAHPGAAQAHSAGSPFYNSVTGGGQSAIFGQGFGGANGTLGFSDSGFGVWGHTSSTDPNNPGTAGIFASGDAGSGAYGRGVLGIAQHGEGVWGVSAYGAGTVGEAQATSFSPGVLGIHDGTGYGVQAYSANGAIDLLVGVNSKQGIIGQVLWGGNWVPGLVVGTQLRDANADMWIGTWGGSRKVAALAPGNTAGGALNYLPTPIRIYDTRGGQPAPLPGSKGTLAGNTTTTMQVTGTVVGGLSVPAGATGVFGNLTVTNTQGAGDLVLWPHGAAKPNASNINYGPGQTVANAVNVGLSVGGALDLFVHVSGTDVIFDVAGFVM
jgi:hypothetical protein